MSGTARRNIHLTLAVNGYDHVRDVVSGAVEVEGVDLTCLSFPVEEIFYRFTHYREWDISELSLAKYASLRASGDQSIIAIPVFPSRAFRHSAIFIRPDGPVDDPTALRGRRVGVPEWTQTATVYARGLLAHNYGVGLDDVEWIQAGTNEPGRFEGVKVEPPPGISIQAYPDRSLNEMLLTGEIDALIAAHPPTDFARGTGRIVRLFSDYRHIEEASYQVSHVFPIMHVLALRSDVHDVYPWVAMNLLKAFEHAKQRSIERVLDANAPLFPMPWGPANAARAQSIIGTDFWPYGIDANRATLDAFLSFAYEQGVCVTRLAPEDLFAPQVQTSFRI